MIDLRLGDCIEVLRTLPDNSVDSIVTDPPYHLTSITKRFGKEGSAPAQYGTDGAFARASKGFMGKEWDGGDIAFRTDVWKECFRVLKPGGHLLSFGGSRTYHRMAVAIEDAGFEVRDQIMWIYGSGFPKSHNIGKAIDKIQGNEREVVGVKEHAKKDFKDNLYAQDPANANNNKIFGYGEEIITKGQSEWEGWGTALKPAHEPICMARKPLSEKSIAENVLKWGTGGINIDGCRIGSETIITNGYGDKGFVAQEGYEPSTHEGRFPANIMFDEEAGKLLDEQSGTSKTRADKNYKHSNTNSNSEIFNGRGTYTPRQDEGGASRFFYCPKVSKKERNAGLENTPDKILNRVNSGGLEHDKKWAPVITKNHHPTVKPIKLMEYLITLVTPQGGVVLEPFMGSGSTGIAAKNLEMSFIGIEKEQEYFDIAKQRIGL